MTFCIHYNAGMIMKLPMQLLINCHHGMLETGTGRVSHSYHLAFQAIPLFCFLLIWGETTVERPTYNLL